jgi:hypothetical protein
MLDWLRLYHALLHDPKVQELPGDDFKGWVNCLLVASQNSPRGQLPPLANLAFLLRLSVEQTKGLCGRLVERGLLETVRSVSETGETRAIEDGPWEIHNFTNRQYDDLSTQRVKRFRARQRFRNVSETDETPIDTEEKRGEEKRGEEKKKRSLSLAFAGQHLSVTEQQDGLLTEAFPWVDLPAEYRRMGAWLQANPRKRPKAPSKFIYNWLARIDPPSRGGRNGQPASKNDPDVARRAAENFARRPHGKRGFDLAGGVARGRSNPAKA